MSQSQIKGSKRLSSSHRRTVLEDGVIWGLLKQPLGPLSVAMSFRPYPLLYVYNHNLRPGADYSQTQDVIIAQTAAASRLRDIRSMYVSGELAAVRIDVTRVAFNKDLHECLLDAAKMLRASEDIAMGSFPGQNDADESQNSGSLSPLCV